MEYYRFLWAIEFGLDITFQKTSLLESPYDCNL